MTPKEKAQELIDKFKLKPSALMCVCVVTDLIKEEQHEKFHKELIGYWDKVTTEINKS